jgi:hypothetical protein
VQMSPALSTIGVTKGRTSKTSTPVVSTFAESQTRARSSRNNNNTNSETAALTTKRNTHKKSNSTVSAAYKAKIAQQEDEEESSREGDDEDDESEPRYCYCNQVSFGEMVACDNDACPTEWFHLSCVGLAKPPGRNGTYSSLPGNMILLMGCADWCSEMVLYRVQGEYEAWPSVGSIVSYLLNIMTGAGLHDGTE